MADQYKSMTELAANTTENSDWTVIRRDLNSQVIISAIHGGAIEPGTTEIADLTSQKGDFDYFTFKGTKSKGNEVLHVTSRHYDQPDMMEMVKDKSYAIAIHGCVGDDKVVYMGGKDENLIRTLTEQFVELNIKVDQAPQHMSGAHDDNIINCCSTGKGVQLELTSGLRKLCFKNQKYNKHSREDQNNWSQFMDDFTSAIVKAIKKVQ